MNEITEEACPGCGLIQLKDIIWGFGICDSPSAVFGCLDRSYVEEIFPDLKYEENTKRK